MSIVQHVSTLSCLLLYLHLVFRAALCISLMVEAVSTSDTSVDF